MVRRREDGKLDDMVTSLTKIRRRGTVKVYLKVLKRCIEEVLGDKAQVRAYSEET